MTGRSHAFGPSIVAAVFVAVAGIFWPTFSTLLGLGRNSDYSSHGALVVLVALVLVWSVRAKLANLPIRPFLPGLIGLIVLGFVWLSGELIFTRVLTQFAVLSMIPVAILTLLGFRWLVPMAFPLAVLMFAVPIWSPLVPTLVKWTAKFAELGIRTSGVPIFREGAYFVLPSGNWSVADTCSGVAFFSTCLLLGVLYAWTIYDSYAKRIVFVVGSAVIGIVGNWVRVYLTIMIAHHTDNRLLRDDHYMFGWLLFALFLFVFCWLGWRYRDSDEPQSQISPTNHLEASKQPSVPTSLLAVISLAALAILASWPILKTKLLPPKESNEIRIANLPPQAGWSGMETSTLGWAPEISNPTRIRVQVFEKNGQRVNVFIGVFQNENWDSKLVTSANHLTGGDKSNWNLVDRGSASTELSGAPLQVKAGVVLGRAGKALAWHWYWVDGISTGNDLYAKFQQLTMRLRGIPNASVWVSIYTDANVSAEVSSKLLNEFMHDMGGSLDGALAQTTNH